LNPLPLFYHCKGECIDSVYSSGRGKKRDSSTLDQVRSYISEKVTEEDELDRFWISFIRSSNISSGRKRPRREIGSGHNRDRGSAIHFLSCKGIISDSSSFTVQSLVLLSAFIPFSLI